MPASGEGKPSAPATLLATLWRGRMGSTESPQALPRRIADSVVGYWTFDEESGEICRDLSGRGNDGTLEGSFRRVDGKRGKAIELDGGSLDVASLSDGNFPSTGTLALWVRFDFHTSALRLILGNSENLNQIAVRLTPEAVLKVWFIRETEEAPLLYMQKNLSARDWLHLAIVWDASNRKGRIFVDGVLESERDFKGGAWRPDGQPFHFSSKPGMSYCLDEIVLCDRPLSAEEIQMLCKSP